MKERIRSTHVHDNNGKDDIHLFPLVAEGGTIDWKKTMGLLRSRAGPVSAAAGIEGTRRLSAPAGERASRSSTAWKSSSRRHDR